MIVKFKHITNNTAELVFAVMRPYLAIADFSAIASIG